jgi:hypothetical protein
VPAGGRVCVCVRERERERERERDCECVNFPGALQPRPQDALLTYRKSQDLLKNFFNKYKIYFAGRGKHITSENLCIYIYTQTHTRARVHSHSHSIQAPKFPDYGRNHEIHGKFEI